jgi:protein TonB
VAVAAPTPSTAAAAAPSPSAAVPAPAEPAPARTVPPSSSAAYLNNPPPAYPAMSRRLGESGTVVLRVLIGVNGRAEKAQIDKSSGYERLDQAALETARDRWRYVPGTRNGVPEAMWFKVPIKFVLE